MNALLNILAVAPDFLRALAALLPVNGAPLWVQTLLSLGAQLIEVGDAGAADLAALTQQIKSMTAQGRDPTQAEWDALRSRSDAAHATIASSTP